MVVGLLAGFFVACGCQVFLVVGLVFRGFSGPPNWVGGFHEQLLRRTLVASLTMFSLMVHRETAVFRLGLVDGSSSLLEFQVSVCAMVVGRFVEAAVVGCRRLVFFLRFVGLLFFCCCRLCTGRYVG